ncbi:MAG: hypothetical protein GY708_20200, partial [Actinomycetia bacterium]|nr:hypothetical protein [Actinomycetes bacterium]
MVPRQIKPSRGEALGAGQRARRGFLLQALNSRYLPSDDKDRLWALAGRSRYGSLPGNPVQIFPFYIDGGTSKLCAHVGGKIYEGDLGATGGFVEAYEMSGTLTPPRGTPVPYKSILHYPIGSTVWDSDKPMLTRTT